MNFLSHYYFERYALSHEQVLGGLLPDLLKHVDKRFNFQFHKFEDQFNYNSYAKSLTSGWKRHLLVDKIFHSSDFFFHHTHELRVKLDKIVQDLPVRASFLGHISLELLLDHLLIANNILSVNRFYEHLESINKKEVEIYLSHISDVNNDDFFKFYDKFVSSRYIFDYEKIENIPYALLNICKRVWKFEYNDRHIQEMTYALEQYKQENLKDYPEIYSLITKQID